MMFFFFCFFFFDSVSLMFQSRIWISTSQSSEADISEMLSMIIWDSVQVAVGRTAICCQLLLYLLFVTQPLININPPLTSEFLKLTPSLISGWELKSSVWQSTRRSNRKLKWNKFHLTFWGRIYLWKWKRVVTAARQCMNTRTGGASLLFSETQKEVKKNILNKEE